jgi:nitroreductase
MSGPTPPSSSTAPALLDAVARRRSGRAFLPRAVPAEALWAVLEAGRWAPSAANEQPWRYLLATGEDADAHAAMLSCLSRGNQWAAAAPVLLLSLANTAFTRKEGENRHAWHDTGIALGMMALQAVSMGLMLHPMGGIRPERIRELYALPAGVEPVAAMALGYPGPIDVLPDDLQAKERRPRRRRPLSETVFAGRYGTAARLAGSGDAT